MSRRIHKIMIGGPVGYKIKLRVMGVGAFRLYIETITNIGELKYTLGHDDTFRTYDMADSPEIILEFNIRERMEITTADFHDAAHKSIVNVLRPYHLNVFTSMEDENWHRTRGRYRTIEGTRYRKGYWRTHKERMMDIHKARRLEHGRARFEAGVDRARRFEAFQEEIFPSSEGVELEYGPLGRLQPKDYSMESDYNINTFFFKDNS